MQPAAREEELFTILVVDDDPTILTLVRDVLSMVPDCRVITASHPSEAMALVIKESVDIVFTDINMPDVNGLEMVKDIISLEKTPEIIIMTAYPNGSIAEQAMELGAISLLAKPFDNIAQLEDELSKAIKRILRQRASQKDVEEKKRALAAKPQVSVDDDPVMKVSFDQSSASPMEESQSEQVASSEGLSELPPPPSFDDLATPISASTLSTDQLMEGFQVKIYPHSLVEPLIEIEMPRCGRYNRQFVVGVVEIPESTEALTAEDRDLYRKSQAAQIKKCIRTSDVLLEDGDDGFMIIGYECNRLGAGVVEHKLRERNFDLSGFAVFPTDGRDPKSLLAVSRKQLQLKRKMQIIVYEPEEFFGRIVQNMLLDPKYEVTWFKAHDEAFDYVQKMAETLKLFIMAMSRDKTPWQLLARFVSEKLIQWPILLFVDIPLTREVKEKIRKLGVRAVVNKGISQDEFMYIVQSLAMPKKYNVERRNYRALVTLPVLYKVDGRERSSNTFTLSREGVFIRDLDPPTSGSIIEIEMFIPGQQQPLRTKGEVLYTIPYFVGVNRFHVAGMAVKFLDFSEAESGSIDEFVGRCMTTYLL